MTKRRRVPAPILSRDFVWIPSAEHDAGSDKFRERQRARMVAAQAKAAPAVNVAEIRRKAAQS